MSRPPAGAPDGAAPHTGGEPVGDSLELSPELARAMLRGGPPWVRNFGDLSYEWRRLFAEVLGTFFVVLAGAGSAVVAASHPGVISAPAHYVVPALVVMALILAIGAVSGAHFNPVVTFAFAMRSEFPWRRIPLYLVAQLAGAVLASAVIRDLLGTTAHSGATLPGQGVSDAAAMGMEAVLTFGLLTVILGTASGAQNVGPLSAIAVGGYIALAGIGFGPVSAASMNPVRSLGPDLVRGDYAHLWPYLAGPTIGMLAAIAAAIVLRGWGRDESAARAAQGSLGSVAVDQLVREAARRVEADEKR